MNVNCKQCDGTSDCHCRIVSFTLFFLTMSTCQQRGTERCKKRISLGKFQFDLLDLKIPSNVSISPFFPFPKCNDENSRKSVFVRRFSDFWKCLGRKDFGFNVLSNPKSAFSKPLRSLQLPLPLPQSAQLHPTKVARSRLILVPKVLISPLIVSSVEKIEENGTSESNLSPIFNVDHEEWFRLLSSWMSIWQRWLQGIAWPKKDKIKSGICRFRSRQNLESRKILDFRCFPSFWKTLLFEFTLSCRWQGSTECHPYLKSFFGIDYRLQRFANALFVRQLFNV